ncbi:unnamed protein product [Lactuca saligna]|uniref:Uncharacterized protein n=1 Tax=Lactuca saligna TaxID=75948 RepID=A0AA35YVZ4_LACSI|nr:unnamed protein product [Lactuca saligna]
MIFYDCGEKVVEQQGQVKRINEERGRDYLHSRVDVLNMKQRFDHVEKQIKSIALLVVGIIVVMFLVMIFIIHLILNRWWYFSGGCNGNVWMYFEVMVTCNKHFGMILGNFWWIHEHDKQ